MGRDQLEIRTHPFFIVYEMHKAEVNKTTSSKLALLSIRIQTHQGNSHKYYGKYWQNKKGCNPQHFSNYSAIRSRLSSIKPSCPD